MGNRVTTACTCSHPKAFSDSDANTRVSALPFRVSTLVVVFDVIKTPKQNLPFPRHVLRASIRNQPRLTVFSFEICYLSRIVRNFEIINSRISEAFYSFFASRLVS